jgi:hypothetical protein
VRHGSHELELLPRESIGASCRDDDQSDRGAEQRQDA